MGRGVAGLCRSVLLTVGDNIYIYIYIYIEREIYPHNIYIYIYNACISSRPNAVLVWLDWKYHAEMLFEKRQHLNVTSRIFASVITYSTLRVDIRKKTALLTLLRKMSAYSSGHILASRKTDVCLASAMYS